MNAVKIIHDQTGRFRRAAALDGDGRLIDLYVDNFDRPTLEGAVYFARVEQILKDRNAAFVGLGGGLRGMLAAADARPAPAKDVGLGSLLRSGQTVIVQVKADPVGDKVAVVSMDVALPGRLLTHLPLGRGVMASKRLAGDADKRQALRQDFARRLPAQGGWIARAAAVGADDAALQAEAATLAERWRAVAEDAGKGGGPRLLRPAPDALERAQTAYAAPPSAVPPDLDLDAVLAALSQPHVPLRDGGALIIESTAALTAVDVDGGGRGNPLTVNLAAADELARQLRLRNIGGMVLVDFIRMKARSDQEQAAARLRRAVADDPAQTDVYGFTRLGLMELTRARRGRSLAETLAETPAQ
jgi:ribonuclease G